MTWFSIHGGHSGQFCRHAKGTLEDVVKSAIKRGFTHYGLAEHCPRYRKEDLFPDESDLGTSDLEDLFTAYFVEARKLQEKYSDRINLLVGFESERLPPTSWLETMEKLRNDYQPDFIVGSVHDVRGICIDYNPEFTAKATSACGGPANLHREYFLAVKDMALNLKPDIVGHFDLVRKFCGETANFSENIFSLIEECLEAVKSVDAVLDVNPGAFRRGYSAIYPLPKILQIAKRMNIGVTLGDDSHGSHDVGIGLEECIRVISTAGYEKVHYFELEKKGKNVLRKTVDLRDLKPTLLK